MGPLKSDSARKIMPNHGVKSHTGPNQQKYIYTFLLLLCQNSRVAHGREIQKIGQNKQNKLTEIHLKIILFVKTEIPGLRMAPKSTYLIKKKLAEIP